MTSENFIFDDVVMNWSVSRAVKIRSDDYGGDECSDITALVVNVKQAGVEAWQHNGNLVPCSGRMGMMLRASSPGERGRHGLPRGGGRHAEAAQRTPARRGPVLLRRPGRRRHDRRDDCHTVKDLPYICLNRFNR